MLSQKNRLALYMEGSATSPFGKLGEGLLRYSPNEIVCVIDSEHVGKNIRALRPVERSAPVVDSVKEAKALGAEVLVLGIAPPGGLIPESWNPSIDEAVRSGMSIVNGLHDLLGPRYPNLEPNQWIWDVRQEPPGLKPASGTARHLKNRRILMIGTDMAIGKMTGGLEIHKELLRRGKRAEFVATGQIGMVITGSGVPLDAVRVDFAGGAIEREVLRYEDAEYVIVEGQGSLAHPGSTSTLPLLRGSMPTDLVLCHRAEMTHLWRVPEIAVPPLDGFVRLYQDLAECLGSFPRPKLSGVCLNTSHLDEESAIAVCARTSAELGVACVDPIRFGISGLVDELLSRN